MCCEVLLLEELSARLRRVHGEQGLKAVVGADAVEQADLLAALLEETEGTDVKARYALGWFYWYRVLAFRHEPDSAAQNQDVRNRALEMLTPCFVAGMGDLPEELLPELAQRAMGPAAEALLQVNADDPQEPSAAFGLWSRILLATPADHPRRAATLMNFGAALKGRFDRTRAPEELDQAVAVCRQAVDAAPAGHSLHADALSDLGGMLKARFDRTAVPGDLDEAIGICRRALDGTPDGDSDRPRWLSNLCGVLQTRFARTGALGDLDEAVDVGRRAVDTAPIDSHPARAGWLSNLGIALRARFERTGVLGDLDEAVNIGRHAVDASPVENSDRAVYLSNLAAALLARFNRTGVLGDLDEAVDSSRRAAAAVPLDDPNQAVHFMNLGVALQTRFTRTGSTGDLDEAVAAAIQTLAATGAGHPREAVALSNLGTALRARFVLSGDPSDLDNAVRINREAVAATPAGHPDRAAHLSSLATSLRFRFKRTEEPADLDEAVDVARRAVDATPVDDPQRPGFLSGLANALVDQFEQTKALGCLDEAVNAGRRAVDATPADHPDRTAWLANLGYALWKRFERTTVAADIDDAFRAFAAAARVDSARPRLRIDAARAAARLAEQTNDRAGAADLLETAVRVLPELAPRRLRRPDQQHQIAGIAGLANDAAAMVMADTSMPARRRAERALALLETGRAVLLGQILETRGDLIDLRQAHPGLAARFAELRDHLDQDTADTVHTDPVAGRTEGTRDLFVALSDAAGTREPQRGVADRIGPAEELAETLRRIRALDGFATFGLPPASQELLAEAAHGPVVTFNVTSRRCDALILTSDGIASLALPGLTEEALTDRVTAFHQALRGAAPRDPANRDLEADLPRPDAQDTVTSILGWLWDNVTGPVLDHLGIDRTPPGHVTEWPRIWWAPGGRLGLLPLHAAGHHTDPDTPRRRTVMDRVVSSYTPTIRALRHARQSRVAGHPPARSLIVAMPATPGLPGNGLLPYAGEEAEILSTVLPSPCVLIEPPPGPATAGAGTVPTARRVLDELPACAIAHFACHGTHDPRDPAASRLLLHDHAESPLTVAHLAPINLDLAQLAYLSACNTALNTVDVFFDEAIHLASAFQLAGFPHVVGTLWTIDDEIAAEVANRFYSALRDPGTGYLDAGRAAFALHEAVRSLRDKLPLSLWAAHLHSGA